jgi:eukaryotic-like serine/threonine-protein kinase
MHTEPVTSLATNRYRIERELGRGGMGIVYQAFDIERGARVALKALTQSDAINIYRLKNEFRQLSDISHPNLVSLHELTFDGEHWFFTMELVDGVTFDEYVAGAQLSQRQRTSFPQETMVGRARMLRDPSVTLSQPGLAQQGLLPRTQCDLTRLRSALAQLVAAISSLHEAGKLHRDIKPSNVLITPEGRVVVLDFGLVASATRVDQDNQDPERTIGGNVFGTPAYMSPEQAAGEPLTPAGDWYSVGCILYEALTSRLPFDGTVLQILKQKETQEPPRPSEIQSGIPEDLDQLCASLLRRKADERPQSAQLRRWFTGSAVPPTLRSTLAENHAELFVGREPHLATLAAAFERTKAGKSSVVFVHGYSGMGKSALVRCFANDLIRGAEAVVLRGRCYERESVPYKAFDDIIDSLSRYMMRLPSEEASELLPRNIHSLARLFPVLKRVRAIANARHPLHPTSDPHELRNQAFGAFKDLLLRLSDWQPLVINIDDLQWADTDSARLLSYLLSQPDPPPAMFVGVYRREEASTTPFLRHVLADPAVNSSQTVHLRVDALAPDEAALLAEQMLHKLPAPRSRLAQAIARESEGVPFFIGELTRHVQELSDEPQAVTLPDVISTRLRTLSSAGLRLLQVLSVAGRPLEQGVALEAAEILPSDRTTFQELRAARMVRTRGTRQTDQAEAYHDRVRETVIRELPEERIREIHALLAQVSERWGVGEPEQLVVHYAEAGQGGRAGETAIHAARAAAEKLAFDRAADLYRKALELLPDSDKARRQQLLLQLGEALAYAGRGAQSAEAYLCAAAEMDEASARPLKRIAAQQLLASGRFAAGSALTIELLDRAGVPFPDSRPKLKRAYGWTRWLLAVRGLRVPKHVRAAWHAVDAQRDPRVKEQLDVLSLFRELHGWDVLAGAWAQARYLAVALDAGDPSALLDALCGECFHLCAQAGGRHERRARRVLELIQELADIVGTPWAQAKYQSSLAVHRLIAKGQFRDALEAACSGLALLQQHSAGHSWDQTWLTALKFMCLEFTGELSELMRAATQTARDAADRDDRFTFGLLSLALPLAQLMQDDPRAAQAYIAAQARKLDEDFSWLHFSLLEREVDVLLYEGKGVEAFDAVKKHWDDVAKYPRRMGRLAHACAVLMRARTALAAYAEVQDPATLAIILHESQALRQLGAGFAGFGPVIDAQLACLEGDRAAARLLYEEAVRIFAHEQSDHALKYVRYRLGELVGDVVGQATCRDIRGWLEHQGVVDAEQFIRIFLPISGAPRT